MIKPILRKGQTLLELMVSLTLSSFLLLVILHFYSHSQQQNKDLLLRLQLQEELHKMIQVMSKDLRRAGFRARHEKVAENNLVLFEQNTLPKSVAIHQVMQEKQNSCVLFFYDLNKDGCIGVQKSGICLNGAQNATTKIESELFGYRLNKKMIETRLTYKNSVSQTCRQEECRSYLAESACNNNGGWTDLLDEADYQITQLSFDWIGKNGIEVKIKGNLKQRPELEYATSAVIPLLNED